MSNEITSIDEVLVQLDDIIIEAENTNSTLGYFAVLYRKVTLKVKEGIENNFFDDGPRMEKLDVIFALRYLDAFKSWKNKTASTQSWKYTFDWGSENRIIVLQHLLLGMNAHINLDLGIAAAQISRNTNIDELENDFNKINEILSSLVIEVENHLSKIWPMLKRILKWTNKVDDFLVDFSMELARDGAWKFAKTLSKVSSETAKKLIDARDIKVAKKARLVTQPGTIASIILRIVRKGEKGTVSERIKILNHS
jgi:hypothetical protein